MKKVFFCRIYQFFNENVVRFFSYNNFEARRVCSIRKRFSCHWFSPIIVVLPCQGHIISTMKETLETVCIFGHFYQYHFSQSVFLCCCDIVYHTGKPGFGMKETKKQHMKNKNNNNEWVMKIINNDI